MTYEKRVFQVAVVIGALVPIFGGGSGVLLGGTMSGGNALDVLTDSHFRYLSGLLLGIGLAFWSTVPGIEKKSRRFQVLTFIVFVGGLARLYAVTARGWPPAAMQFALVMELIVTPLLCLWQWRVARTNAA
jgi:Domain of unknown function (DUF4345)